MAQTVGREVKGEARGLQDLREDLSYAALVEESPSFGAEYPARYLGRSPFERLGLALDLKSQEYAREFGRSCPPCAHGRSSECQSGQLRWHEPRGSRGPQSPHRPTEEPGLHQAVSQSSLPKTLTGHVCLLPPFFLTASSLRIYRSRVSPLTARRWEALGAPRFVSAAPDAT